MSALNHRELQAIGAWLAARCIEDRSATWEDVPELDEAQWGVVDKWLDEAVVQYDLGAIQMAGGSGRLRELIRMVS